MTPFIALHIKVVHGRFCMMCANVKKLLNSKTSGGVNVPLSTRVGEEGPSVSSSLLEPKGKVCFEKPDENLTEGKNIKRES